MATPDQPVPTVEMTTRRGGDYAVNTELVKDNNPVQWCQQRQQPPGSSDGERSDRVYDLSVTANNETKCEEVVIHQADSTVDRKDSADVPHASYRNIIRAGWAIYWAEGVQLLFWAASGVYICGFTNEKLAVAHLLSTLHFTGSIGIAEVTEHLEIAQAEHKRPVSHFQRSWGFLFILTLLADVLLLLDVIMFLPRDDVTGFVIEVIVGSWGLVTALIIFVWTIVVAVNAKKIPD